MTHVKQLSPANSSQNHNNRKKVISKCLSKRLYTFILNLGPDYEYQQINFQDTHLIVARRLPVRLSTHLTTSTTTERNRSNVHVAGSETNENELNLFVGNTWFYNYCQITGRNGKLS